MTEHNTQPQDAWHTLSGAAAAARLDSSPASGLTEAEAARRRVSFGPNDLPGPPPTTIWSAVFRQLGDPLVIVLLVAAGLSAVLGEVKDAVVVLLVVAANTILGVAQEARAERSLAALKKMSLPASAVLRDGKLQMVPSAELVPGDIVPLEAGAIVPADLRLLEAASLRIDESALTGESSPAEKDYESLGEVEAPLGDRSGMAFRGTTVTTGRGKGLVVATGLHTQLGGIARLLTEQQVRSTPLQKRLAGLGKTLAAVGIGLVAIVFVAGVLRGEPAMEMLMTAVSLAVAIVPEGLPAVVTIVLALGLQRMAQRKAILRRLPAVETLGSATVICSDKTGTLTQNRMTVTRLHLPVPGGATEGLLHLGMALCNDATLDRDQSIGDPTEVALAAFAGEAGVVKRETDLRFPRIGEVPFDSARKLMTTLHRLPDAAGQEGRFVCFAKGAFDSLLPLCSHVRLPHGEVALDERVRAELTEANSGLAGDALRVLAFAHRFFPEMPEVATLEDGGLVFDGLAGIIDPPRPEAAAAVREAQAAGIRTVMITGDHRATAVAIASQLGIWRPGDGVLVGGDLQRLSREELEAEAAKTTVYARVAPEHKLRIVEALQAQGNVVAMTGDGVNDAPALKRADIGAAMGITGTDVAKEAADMVIADDNFATVVAAVREGRTIYANILKAIRYLLSCNSGELLVILVALLAGWGRPLTAIQILWTNLITDSLPALALGVEPPEPGLMERRPRPASEGVFAGGLGWVILAEGAIIGSLTLVGYALARRWTGSQEVASTVAFLTLSLSQLVHAFNTRSSEVSLFRLGLFSNPAMVKGTLVAGGLAVSAVLVAPLRAVFDMAPLGTREWLLVGLLSLMPLVLGEVRKACGGAVRSRRHSSQ